MEMRGDTDVYGGIHLYLFTLSGIRKGEMDNEDSAAYCDYIRRKRQMGKV